MVANWRYTDISWNLPSLLLPLLRLSTKKSLFPVERVAVRPSSNKKLFPVHRPGGLKRAYWNFFFSSLPKNVFFYFPPPVHSSLKRLKLGKKKKIPTSRLAFFLPIRRTGNDFLLKGGLIMANWAATHFFGRKILSIFGKKKLFAEMKKKSPQSALF